MRARCQCLGSNLVWFRLSYVKFPEINVTELKSSESDPKTLKNSLLTAKKT